MQLEPRSHLDGIADIPKNIFRSDREGTKYYSALKEDDHVQKIDWFEMLCVGGGY